MKDGTETKVKFASLQEVLGLTRFEIRGLLDTLWETTKSNAPRGDIGRFTDEWIAKIIGWRYDPESLIEALTENGWIDPHDVFRLVVHDWSHHCEDSVHRKLARSRQWFCDGTRPVLTRLTKAERVILEDFYDNNKPDFVARKVRTSNAPKPCALDERTIRAPQPSLALPSLAKPTTLVASLPEEEADFCDDGSGDEDRCETIMQYEEPSPALDPDDPRVFPTTGTVKLWRLDDAALGKFVAAYDTVDVPREVAKAKMWIESSPERKKTAKGMMRFLNGWMGRAADSPKSNGTSYPPGKLPPEKCVDQEGRISMLMMAENGHLKGDFPHED